MCLRKSVGNMYPWVTHTFNAIKGRCYHRCHYCYMKRFWNRMNKPYLDEKCLRVNLGEGNIIFVGSSIDMWANNIPKAWIQKVIDYCRKFPNTYLFQSKNPIRFIEFARELSDMDIILGTTIETNRNYNFTKAPQPSERARYMELCRKIMGKPIMVSIEPVMDFDLKVMVAWMKTINPEFVSIGADSKHNNLPEPPAEKIQSLIDELKKFTEVKVKDNLRRLLGGENGLSGNICNSG